MRRPQEFNSGDHNGKGHIPGAINIPYTEMIDIYGNTKNKSDLQDLLKNFDLDPTKETVTYCHKGVTAAIGYAALGEAGFDKLRLYDGSWSEFSSHEKTKKV